MRTRTALPTISPTHLRERGFRLFPAFLRNCPVFPRAHDQRTYCSVGRSNILVGRRLGIFLWVKSKSKKSERFNCNTSSPITTLQVIHSALNDTYEALEKALHKC